MTLPACAGRQPPKTSAAGLPPAVRDIQSDLGRVFGAPIMERGVWAVDVISLATGERLYTLNAGRMMMPASNMKILTLAAAAETLGWDYTFETVLEARGSISGGVLHGDLTVRSNGDPTINSRKGRMNAVFDQWATALTAAGINTVDGRIIGDDQAFDDEGIGAGWAWDYLQDSYAAPVGALELNENTAALLVSPGSGAGGSAIVSLEAGSGLTLVNRAITGAPGSEDTVDYRRLLDRPILEVRGSVPAGAGPSQHFVAVVNPTIFFVRSLKAALAARDIAVAGEAVDLDDISAELQAAPATETRVLASTPSPPLREIAIVLMKVSQNLYAETLLKALGAARGGLGTAEGGRVAVRAVFDAWGVPRDAYTMYDGSGLSRYDYVTARALTTVLEHMYRDPRHRDAFLATLPIAGRDGTLASRLDHTRAAGNALAMTGSISNVRSLSGFVRTRDDETLVFSILANGFPIASATVNYIADLAVEILSNFTRK
ncbi:MAG TPA: D-alanyl-D-alanine carboxypeptidase/D-alanyl-D-alanine-endopeptidase [Vicinamibacterales bacterium]|nr:D-alanyl-D-alanine carboxypeptidase/D-alanyl-D-alanine-endopeptidase [Vicinamibacterales bacterium]